MSRRCLHPARRRCERAPRREDCRCATLFGALAVEAMYRLRDLRGSRWLAQPGCASRCDRGTSGRARSRPRTLDSRAAPAHRRVCRRDRAGLDSRPRARARRLRGVESSRPASGPVPDWARQRRADDVAADAIRGSTAGNAIDAVARWAGAPDIGHAPVCRPTYTFCMSKLIAVRLPDEVLSRVDHERRRAGLSRAAAINAALELWIRTRRYDDAVRRDHEGYDRHPIRTDEFEPVLGAQRWPK